jgi:hypothetical protein
MCQVLYGSNANDHVTLLAPLDRETEACMYLVMFWMLVEAARP